MRAFVPTSLRRAAQRGAIAILALITLPILFGFGALVVDLARLFVYRTEIQNAMDSCALAATSSLTLANDPNIFDAAIRRGKATMDITRVGTSGVRTTQSVNRLHFQKDDFDLGNVIVEFNTVLADTGWVAATTASYTGITPVTAKFVRCSYIDAGNTLFFKPLLNWFIGSTSSTATVAGEAVAKLGNAQSVCAFPVAVCITPGTTAAPWGLTPGTRKIGVTDPGSGSYGTGNFGWLDFSPPSGGASEVRNLILGAGTCAVAPGTIVGEAGVMSTLEGAWNSRFGVYRNPLSATTGPLPDFTGHSYPTGSNNYADYVIRQAARTPFQGTYAGPNTVLTSAQHLARGVSRRVVTAAMVDCSVWDAGGANPPVLDFACVLLLAPVANGGSAASWSQVTTTLDIEYLGLADTPGTPCASSGLGGGTFGPLVPVLAK